MNILLASPDNTVSRIVTDVLEENGHSVTQTIEKNLQRIVLSYSESDFLVLNHITTFNRRVIEELEDRSRVIDLSLSKTPMNRYKGQFISLSVLVSPPGENRKSGGRFFLMNDLSPENSHETLVKLFGKLEFEQKTAAEYDRMISEVLVKPYIMALVSRKLSDLDYEEATGEYALIQELARLVTNYNIDTIRDLLRNNPHTGTIVASFEENVKRVWNELSNY